MWHLNRPKIMTVCGALWVVDRMGKSFPPTVDPNLPPVNFAEGAQFKSANGPYSKRPDL